MNTTNNYHSEEQYDNGYGASISCNAMTYGHKQNKFEVALIDSNRDIMTSTCPQRFNGGNPICGWLAFEAVADVTRTIMRLPHANSEPNKPLLTSSFMRGCRLNEGQMRASPKLTHNSGWYNAAGHKIGWGDLDEADLAVLAERMPVNSVIFILGEQDSFWNFVTRLGMIGDTCQTSPDEKRPGIDYMLEKATMVLIGGKRYDVYWASLITPDLPKHVISRDTLRELTAGLLYQPAAV